MEGYSHLAGLLQSTWDASQSYLGQGVHLSSIHSAALEVLRTEAVQYVVSFFPRTLEDLKDRKSTRLNSSHSGESRMPSSA